MSADHDRDDYTRLRRGLDNLAAENARLRGWLRWLGESTPNEGVTLIISGALAGDPVPTVGAQSEPTRRQEQKP